MCTVSFNNSNIRVHTLCLPIWSFCKCLLCEMVIDNLSSCSSWWHEKKKRKLYWCCFCTVQCHVYIKQGLVDVFQYMPTFLCWNDCLQIMPGSVLVHLCRYLLGFRVSWGEITLICWLHMNFFLLEYYFYFFKTSPATLDFSLCKF